MATTKKENNDSPQQEKAILKFCPICGSTMHKELYLSAEWWFCDDPECGYLEPVR